MSEYVIDDRETPRFRIHRSTLISADIFAAEQREIFDHCWLYVGHESELTQPGDFRSRNVGGRAVILLRDLDGNINVFMNTCTHRGTTLCREAQGNTRFLRCFYHSWAFDTKGALAAVPDEEAYGPDFDRQNLGLGRPAQVDSYRGFVFVCFDAGVEDLVTYLGGSREYLDLVCDQSEAGMEIVPGSHEYSMRANWKLLVENSVDAYHGAPTHQRYFRMLKAAGKKDVGGPVLKRGYELGGGHAVTAGPLAELFRPLPTGDAQASFDERRAKLTDKFGEEWTARMYGSRNLLIFPNLLIIDHVMGIVVRKIDPVAPDYTEITAWELAPPEEPEVLRRIRLDNYLTFWGPGGLATPDDVEALECCQRGISGTTGEVVWSDISRGMTRTHPSARDELQMRAFWRRWDEMVCDEPYRWEMAASVATGGEQS